MGSRGNWRGGVAPSRQARGRCRPGCAARPRPGLRRSNRPRRPLSQPEPARHRDRDVLGREATGAGRDELRRQMAMPPAPEVATETPPRRTPMAVSSSPMLRVRRAARHRDSRRPAADGLVPWEEVVASSGMSPSGALRRRPPLRSTLQSRCGAPCARPAAARRCSEPPPGRRARRKRSAGPANSPGRGRKRQDQRVGTDEVPAAYGRQLRPPCACGPRQPLVVPAHQPSSPAVQPCGP